MKKIVVKVDVHDETEKRKALKCVSSLLGIDFLGMDMKDKKLTVTGDIDPVAVTEKLRKHWSTEIISVGAKEEPKKEEKKEEPKKEEPKKDEKKQIEDLIKAYEAYNPCLTKYYFVPSMEDNPNSCSIC